MLQWWKVVYLIILALMSLLTTIVFCFWFVYLLEAIRRKLKFYKHCIEQGIEDSQQQILTYNAKTEYVKNIFLFLLNFVEWIAFIFARIGHILYFTQEYHQKSEVFRDSENDSVYASYGVLFITQGEVQLNYSFAYSFLFLPNTLIVVSLILIASLCMYLASRQADKSWIKSTSIPYLIGFFIICATLNQIIASFCVVHIIADWISIVLTTVSLIIAFQQYKKLNMVINWSIVDLSISKNRVLLRKQKKMKERFTKIFVFIWIGFVSLIICGYLKTIYDILIIALRTNRDETFYLSLCQNPEFPNSRIDTLLSVIFFTKFTFGFIGIACIFIPYIGFGLSTMYVIGWRLWKGKTGYKTHFPNPLYAPLV